MEDVYRRRSCSMPELPPSILKTRSRTLKTRTTSQHDHVTVSKRASFRDNVDVYCYPTRELSLPCFVSEKNTKEHDQSRSAVSRNTPAASRIDNSTANTLIHCVESNITPSEDSQGRTYRRLHIKLAIDESCVRDKTAVKALSGGKAVIIHLYRRYPERTNEEEHLESRLPLPLQIDPYSVKARVHKDGFLTISANIPNIPLKSTEHDN